MKMSIIILAALTLVACADEIVMIPIPVGWDCVVGGSALCQKQYIYRYVCEDKEKVADFILQCAKNANPLSDEEGEDLVRQCAMTGRGLFCHIEYLMQVKGAPNEQRH